MAVEIPEQRASWIKDHMARYLETGGAEGHIWQGIPTLLLTTTGSKSGRKTTTPLIYGREGDNYLVVASKGGAAEHPMWYTNLAADPEVEIQVADEVIQGRARTANAAEKPGLWEIMTKAWPAYNEYQQKTHREIPVVIIEPV